MLIKQIDIQSLFVVGILSDNILRHYVYMLWRIASEGHGNKRVQQINKMCIAYVNTPVHLILIIHRIFLSGFLHLFSNPFNIQDLSIDILSYLHWCSTLNSILQVMTHSVVTELMHRNGSMKSRYSCKRELILFYRLLTVI